MYSFSHGNSWDPDSGSCVHMASTSLTEPSPWPLKFYFEFVLIVPYLQCCQLLLRAETELGNTARVKESRTGYCLHGQMASAGEFPCKLQDIAEWVGQLLCFG